jgi:hypothetical protein
MFYFRKNFRDIFYNIRLETCIFCGLGTKTKMPIWTFENRFVVNFFFFLHLLKHYLFPFQLHKTKISTSDSERLTSNVYFEF